VPYATQANASFASENAIAELAPQRSLAPAVQAIQAMRGKAAKLAKLQALPKPALDIAWKAQTRLCARYRTLTAKGKKPTVAVTAIAREMAAFIWAIVREVQLAQVPA
jgi:hypothetical protein